MPVTSGDWTVQGYRWAPCYGPQSQHLLQRVGHRGEGFAIELAAQALGAGLDADSEIQLVWAGQVKTDPHITERDVTWRKERMGAEGWKLLVQWFALTYTTWLQARINARAELRVMAIRNKRRRV